MKKSLVLIVIVLNYSVVFSQSEIKTDSGFVGTWNASKNEFDWGEMKKLNVTFNFTDSIVYTSDTNKSFYKVLKLYPTDSTEKYKLIHSDCVDNRNRNCTFNIKMYFDGDQYIIIEYESVCYIYHIDSSSE